MREVVAALSIDEALRIERTVSPALWNASFECFAAAKIDVEGSEVSAILGAASIMRGQCPPCDVIIEQLHSPVHANASVPRPRRPPLVSKPVDLLRAYGYLCRAAASYHYHCMLRDALRPGASRCLDRHRRPKR